MNKWFNRSLLIQDEAAGSFYTVLCSLTDDQVVYLTEELRSIARHLDFDPEVFEKLTGEALVSCRQEQYELEEQAYEEYQCQTS